MILRKQRHQYTLVMYKKTIKHEALVVIYFKHVFAARIVSHPLHYPGLSVTGRSSRAVCRASTSIPLAAGYISPGLGNGLIRFFARFYRGVNCGESSRWNVFITGCS